VGAAAEGLCWGLEEEVFNVGFVYTAGWGQDLEEAKSCNNVYGT